MEKIITTVEEYNKAVKNNNFLKERLETIDEFKGKDRVEINQVGDVKVKLDGFGRKDGWVRELTYLKIDVDEWTWKEWEEIENKFLDEGIGSTAQY